MSSIKTCINFSMAVFSFSRHKDKGTRTQSLPKLSNYKKWLKTTNHILNTSILRVFPTILADFFSSSAALLMLTCFTTALYTLAIPNYVYDSKQSSKQSSIEKQALFFN